MKITAIKQQVKRPDRYSIFVDGTFAFGLSEAGLIESGLASGQELTPAELKTLKEKAGIDKAHGQALRYVALRPRSEWEVMTYLQRKAVDSQAAAIIIGRLRELQLLDDEAFARTWIANRRLLKSTSLQRLRLELKTKRVPDEVITRALFSDTGNDQQALRELIAKKRRRYPDEQKLMQYLARQGFRYDDIKQALANNED